MKLPVKIPLSFFFALCSLFSSSFSQTNLVPNPSFEIYTLCPDNISGTIDDQVSRATGWSTYSETPDYFHTCGTIWNVGVPNNQPGYQFANTGNAYCGVVTYQGIGFYREIVGRVLASSLTIGQKYYISFFVNLAGKQGASMATDKMGLKFSTIPYSYSNPIAINNSAHLYTDSILTDTVNWTRISGSFIADSSYQYVAIGNFFDDLNTDTLSVDLYPFVGYYFVDDVCVTTDSLYNENWTGINYYKKTSIQYNLYPNPFSSEINISSNKPNSIVNIEIYNSLGEEIKQINMVNLPYKISIDEVPGVYFIKIIYDDIYSYTTIIKQ